MTIRVGNIVEEGRLGGPQMRIVRVAAALPADVVTVVIMPKSGSGAFQQLCVSHNVAHRAVPLTRITKELSVALKYVLFWPFEVVYLANFFRREKITLVHVSGGSWQIKGVIAARLVDIPSVWHLNDTAMPRWLRAVFRLVQPLATGFIFASERSRDYYAGAIDGGRPETTVPSSVDLTYFDPAERVGGDEEVIAGFGDAPVIGCVANINPVKGIEMLFHAAACVGVHYPKLRVVLVGPVFSSQQRYGEQLVQLARKLDVQVDWLGGRAEVRPLLSRFDVYVCSSVSESSPVSVWEAMAMAKPVVSTDVGDVFRHLVDGESGYVVPVGDVEAMAERICSLLGDPAKRLRMGQSARKAAEAFLPECIAAKTRDIYQRVVALQP